ERARVRSAGMPAMMLPDMGADVLKIEAADPERPTAEEWVRRTIHAFTKRNKRSITLNMKAAEGQAIFRKLAATADVIVEGFRPGVMRRLGADYETIRALNPRIVYCSLSGFGQDGPYRDYPAHDMNYLSLAGVLNLIGDAGSKKPVIPLNLGADYAGDSLHGSVAVGELLPLHRPARLRALRAPARSARARRQPRGAGRARGDREDHPHARPRRVVRAAREGRRVRRQGLRRRRDGARSADQPPADDRRGRASDPRARAPGGHRDQALRDAGQRAVRRPARRRA